MAKKIDYSTDRIKNNYDREQSTEKDLLKSIIKKSCEELQFKSALDIGCGPGELAEVVSTFTSNLTLMDMDSSLKPKLTERFPDAKIIIDSFNTHHFEENFDLILFSHALYYQNPSHWISVTKKALDLCAPGGTVIIVSNADSGDWWKIVDRFYSKIDANVSLNYRPFNEYKADLSKICNFSTQKFKYEWKVPKGQDISDFVLNSLFVANNDSPKSQFSKEIREFCEKNLKKKGDEFIFSIDCEVLTSNESFL